MKNKLMILAFCFVTFSLVAQVNKDIKIPLIGEIIPSFVAESTVGKIKFPDDYFAKWKILFSHPADFTPVCTSEIIELANLQEEFRKLNTQVLVISTDGINSHLEWIKSIESIEYKGKKTVKIEFPLISDFNYEISKKYGMLQPSASNTKDVRGVFIIDSENKVRTIFYYPSNVGRNFDEILRTLKALQNVSNESVLTPANWKPGDDVLIPSPSNIDEANKLKDKNSPNLYSYAWYMWFKKSK